MSFTNATVRSGFSRLFCSADGTKAVAGLEGGVRLMHRRQAQWLELTGCGCSQVMLSDGSVVDLSSDTREKIAAAIEAEADQALRCLAFASKSDLGALADYDGEHHPSHRALQDPASYARVESDLVWLGVAALQDPPRPEVKAAISACHDAGIRVRP